jgi:6-phosphogluconolactonase
LLCLWASPVDADSLYLASAPNPKKADSPSGIFRVEFNVSDGSFGQPQQVLSISSPSFFNFHPEKLDQLFVVHTTAGQPTETVSIIHCPEAGLATIQSQLPTLGKSSCHIAVSPKHSLAFWVNYNSKNIAAALFSTDLKWLEDSTLALEHQGSSINPKRQLEPHPHSVNLSKDERFAFVCDLGTDEIISYSIDSTQKPIFTKASSWKSTVLGSGPRHLAVHPTLPITVCNHEITLEVSLLSFNPLSGELTELDRKPTIDDIAPSDVIYSTSEVLWHPSLPVFYVANRGHNSISTFAFNPDTKKIQRLQVIKIQSDIPRNFGLHHSGQWLIVGGQKNDLIESLKIDPKLGTLTLTPHQLALANPMCIRFKPVKKTS